MKYYVVSDIHGHFDLMREALAAKGFDEFNPDHCLISCGDLFDRGPQNKECLEWIMSLPNRILIRGNHEDLLEDILRGHGIHSYDKTNGTVDTIRQIAAPEEFKWFEDQLHWVQRHELLWQYLNECKDYAKVGTNIFVHGWIPDQGIEDLDAPNRYTWREARWLNGMKMWDWGSRIEGYTIWCGHWHTTWGRANIDEVGREWPVEDTSEEISKLNWSTWRAEGIVALDGCIALSGVVNVEVFEI